MSRARHRATRVPTRRRSARDRDGGRRGGADAIGVAGGDGSQAVVAEIASAHDIPYVCIPAGTRNHFANDLGVDRSDVVGALDAFAHGSERRIDLARLNGRVFVNNASLGVYAKIVQSERYRDAKLETVARAVARAALAARRPVRSAVHCTRRHSLGRCPSRPRVEQPVPAAAPRHARHSRGNRQRAPRRDRRPRAHTAATRGDRGDGADRRSAEISGITRLHDAGIHRGLDRTGGRRARRRSARRGAAAAVRVAAVGVAGAGDAAGARAGLRIHEHHSPGREPPGPRSLSRRSEDPRASRRALEAALLRASRAALARCFSREDYWVSQIRPTSQILRVNRMVALQEVTERAVERHGTAAGARRAAGAPPADRQHAGDGSPGR